MALYARLLGRDDTGASTGAGKIPVHQFCNLLGEFARGKITGAQANAAIVEMTGVALDAGEQTEATTLLATITGAATAKLARAMEINDVLTLAENSLQQIYPTPAATKTRLGV